MPWLTIIKIVVAIDAAFILFFRALPDQRPEFEEEREI